MVIEGKLKEKLDSLNIKPRVRTKDSSSASTPTSALDSSTFRSSRSAGFDSCIKSHLSSSLNRAAAQSTNEALAVRVIVRCRPLSDMSAPACRLEAESTGIDKVNLKLICSESIVESAGTGSDEAKQISREPRNFRSNAFLGPMASQEETFGQVSDIVQPLMQGNNLSVLCHGISGSGKTFTLLGPNQVTSPSEEGIIQRLAQKIFEYIRDRSQLGEVFLVEASCLQIFSSDGLKEELVDLLDEEDKVLSVKQDPKKLTVLHL